MIEILEGQLISEPESDWHQDHGHIERIEFARVALVAIAAVLDWLGVVPAVRGFDFLATTALLIGGYPVFAEAFENLVSRRMTMELSMTIALVAAAAIREFFTALIILLFVLIAEILEGVTVDRGRRAIQMLVDLLPRRANIRRGDVVIDVPIEEVKTGDLVIVKPGADIPVDGVVSHGHSFVNQASITGESLPAEKIAGTKVFAGTTNLNGSLEVETISIGRETIFGKIIEAVEQAEQSRAPIQRLADRLAGYLVYFAMGAAVLTFVLTHNVRSTIAVIIVAGACGIAAGTPLAILGAIGRAARQGAIIKGGRYLELLGEIDTVVLDKTGTLTFGDPEVTKVCPAPGVTERVLIEAAILAERLSDHPLAKAILKRASHLALPAVEPDSFEYFPGKGVRCSVFGDQILAGNRSLLVENGVRVPEDDPAVNTGTRVLISRCGMLLGSLRIEDRLRPEAIDAVEALKGLRMRVVLLTGDSAVIARLVADQLGVDEVAAELAPSEKLERIDQIMKSGRLVAMVGDGINDAPALAKATVGVAMGSGTDIARQSADVLLIGNNLLDFVETLRTARRCRNIILTNFAGTLIVDAIGVLLAAWGMLNPLFAAFIHVASELTFIANSARLVPSFSTDKGKPSQFT